MANWTHALPAFRPPTPFVVGACTVEVDRVSQPGWNDVLQQFDDANLIQTWSYAAHRWGRNNLSHVVLRQHGEVLAAAQVIIKTIPFLGAGIAYVKSGPLWQRRGHAPNPDVLRQILRELRKIYVDRRGLLLRIFPAETDDCTGTLPALYAEEGFQRDPKRFPGQTAVIDLSYSLELLRSSLRPTWRRNLVLAERNGLNLLHGTASDLFDVFAGLYRDMLRRKHRVSSVGIDRFLQIQRDLPETQKLRVMICECAGEPVAGLAAACFGNTALNVLSATAEKGLQLRASYFSQWNLLQWLKASDCRWYDLDLIDAQAYPGMTQFKLGLAGRLGLTLSYLGPFESCARPASRISVQLGSQLRTAFKRVKQKF